MARATYTVTLSRVFWLRILPGAWRDVVCAVGLPLWHPVAIWLIVLMFWRVLARGGP